MINKELSKEELSTLLFKNENQKHGGTYGIVTKYAENLLIKIYYKDIFDAYISKDISKIDKEIQDRIEIDELLKRKSNVSIMIDKIEQLKQTKSKDLIQGIATYNGYLIGIFLEEYKDYEVLGKVFPKLNEKEREKVLAISGELVEDLYRHGIIPRDIKEDNILVRKSDLDVKIIDLDDVETRYEDEEYLNEFPYIKAEANREFSSMKNRLNNIEEIER